MHQVRLADGVAGIIYMYLLHGLIATVHVVELQFVHINAQVTDGVAVVTGKFGHLGHHHALHRQIDGFLRAIAIDGRLLGEVSQLPGIVRHFDFELGIA